MPRYVAFLRGLNVGGHTIKMDRLKADFEALDFQNVSTFIASGNVIFETEDTDEPALEARIDAHLKQSFGYEAACFLRSEAEMVRIAQHNPFPQVSAEEWGKPYVNFFRAPLPADQQQKVLALASETDLAVLDGRELYFLPKASLLDSAFGTPLFTKAIGKTLTTNRNLNTIKRIVAKFAV